MQFENRMRVDTDSVAQAGNDLADALNKWLIKYGPDVIYKTCASCKFMTEGNNAAHCSKYNMVPPARVILTGCSEHSDKEAIPF
jgi:hypothetical protein